MLYQFSFKNFKSYKNETIFDMRAENIGEFEDALLIDKNQERLLPVSVIYGPNAGGKSGLIEALRGFITLVIEPRRILMNDDKKKYHRIFASYNDIKPYMFDDESKNEPTEFQIYFSTESNEYRYNLSIQNNIIINESLYKKGFKAKKPAKIFEREKENISLGESLKKSSASKNVNDNMPYLTFISITNNNETIKDVIGWFENITAIDYAKNVFERRVVIYDDIEKDLFLALIEAMDIDICDYRIEEKDEDKKRFKLFTKHKKNNKEYEIEFIYESEGTRKLFSLIPELIEAMRNGGLVIIDELDAKLHPKLLKYIIMLFKANVLNRKNAQLIFTSQDLTTMNNQVFRRDEIWFACKNDDKESEIYSLYEIRDENGEHIRASAPYNKQYLSGKYGADPYLAKMLSWEE